MMETTEEGKSCLVCDLSMGKPLGPARYKSKYSERGISQEESLVLCKALRLPQSNFETDLFKFPFCIRCCKKVQRISQTVAALEKLQDAVDSFRNEVQDLLQRSYDAALERAYLEEVKREDDLQNDFRKQIIDVLQLQEETREIKRKSKPAVKRKAVKVKAKDKDKGILDKINNGKEKPLIDKELFVKLTPLDLDKLCNLTLNFKQIPIITEVRTLNPSAIQEEAEEVGYALAGSDDDWQPPSSPTNDNDEDSDFESLIVIKPEYMTETEGGSADEQRGKDLDERVTRRKSNFKNTSKPQKTKIKKKANAKMAVDMMNKKLQNITKAGGPPKKKPKILKKEKVVCKECNKKFRSEFHLKIHTKKVHLGIEKPFDCTVEGCERAFNNTNRWKAHCLEHSTGARDPKYQCDICKKVYLGKNSLDRHRSRHTGNWKFPCTVCNKGYHRPSSLKEHMERHETGKLPTLQCPYCDNGKFTTKKALTEHQTAAHPDNDLTHNTRCEYCSKVFSGRDALRCHIIQMHNGKFKHGCDQCGKGFAKKSWLIRHLLQHSTARNFACDECPATFRFPNSLQAHKMKHQGNYPFTCSVCDKKFILRAQFQIHEAIHSKEKPFICEYCGKTFILELYLRSHRRRLHWKEEGRDAPPEYYKKRKDIVKKKNLDKRSNSKKPENIPGETGVEEVDGTLMDIDETELDENAVVEVEVGGEIGSKDIEIELQSVIVDESGEILTQRIDQNETELSGLNEDLTPMSDNSQDLVSIEDQQTQKIDEVEVPHYYQIVVVDNSLE